MLVRPLPPEEKTNDDGNEGENCGANQHASLIKVYRTPGYTTCEDGWNVTPNRFAPQFDLGSRKFSFGLVPRRYARRASSKVERKGDAVGRSKVSVKKPDYFPYGLYAETWD